jgi:hypothetical protein
VLVKADARFLMKTNDAILRFVWPLDVLAISLRPRASRWTPKNQWWGTVRAVLRRNARSSPFAGAARAQIKPRVMRIEVLEAIGAPESTHDASL